MRRIVLDPTGDLPDQNGLTVVDSEVAFARLATSTISLLIRGKLLCEWADDFFNGRGIEATRPLGIANELTNLFPQLKPTTISELAKLLSPYNDQLSRPLSVKGVLATLAPNSIWHEDLSCAHAAQWLLWLCDEPPDGVYQPLLNLVSQQWEQEANGPEAAAYAIHSQEAASDFLLEWVGIHQTSMAYALGEFPVEPSERLVSSARQEWNRESTLTKGQFFADIPARQMPYALKCIAAEAAAEYYIHHPLELTTGTVIALGPFLPDKTRRQLAQSLPPSVPPPLPQTPTEVLLWFRDSYLPYRQWQSECLREDARPAVLGAAMEFAQWYLAQYPKALAGGELRDKLSFTKVLGLEQDQDLVTLVIVLDGLHVGDAAYLRRQIQQEVRRLTPVAEELAFAPLPTVTEFTKNPLFKGVPSDRASDVPDVGHILPESKTPVAWIKQAVSPQLYFWRVLEPDYTYHHNNGHDMLRQDIESALAGIATKIREIVDNVPGEIRLRVVITSDHGRLLAKSERQIPVPAGMQSHGRAAWGAAAVPASDAGYAIEGEFAYLHRSRFGLPEHAAVVLTESSFCTNDGKTGSEIYPHGGLFPEEVIVPWIVLMRDFTQPTVEIKLTGSAMAGTRGELTAVMQNFDDIKVVVREIVIIMDERVARLPVERELMPRSIENTQLIIDTWPTKSELKAVRVSVNVALGNHLEFLIPAHLHLESEEMYHREDDPLEGLDL